MKLLYMFLPWLSFFALKAQLNFFIVAIAGIGDIKAGIKKADFEKIG